jgi:hypothetical protein
MIVDLPNGTESSAGATPNSVIPPPPGNSNGGGGGILSTVDLLIKVACLAKKLMIFSMYKGDVLQRKDVSTRRSTVLSLPLQ